MRLLTSAFAVAVAISFFGVISSSHAMYMITDADIFVAEGHVTHSGNGTLDLILLTESMGGIENIYKIGGTTVFDGDDGNSDMPTGSGKTTSNESYMTSIGEIRDFYRLNFSDGLGGSTVDEIVLFVDLNQVTGDDLTIGSLEIVVDYSATFGDDRDNPWGTDISSGLQNGTDAGYTGGTTIAQLDGSKILDMENQGAGWGDYGIHTGINPFDGAFSDDTRILFHWESSGHSDGGETIFLSGEYTEIPEPSMFVFLGLGALGLIFRKKK